MSKEYLYRVVTTCDEFEVKANNIANARVKASCIVDNSQPDDPTHPRYGEQVLEVRRR